MELSSTGKTFPLKSLSRYCLALESQSFDQGFLLRGWQLDQ